MSQPELLRSSSRLNIGLLLSNLAGGSKPDALRAGVGEAARRAGANLICFAGGHLRDPYEFNAQANAIYALASARRLDGLVIWTSSVGTYIGPEATRDFCAQFAPLPIVGIGMALEGIPSLVLDSYQGMKEAVLHLIQVHGRRRLAFIRGPEGHRDASERFRAYCDALLEAGLDQDDRLVSPASTWGEQVGVEAIRVLMDARRARFDAVVSVNDSMAAGALRALQTRGVRVPDDISIAGFDDEAVSRVVSPPLTTVPARMYERGRQAVELLLALMQNQAVPEQITTPTHLIVRQSCGCMDPLVAEAVSATTSSLGPLLSAAPEMARLETSFLEELSGKAPGAFLRTLERLSGPAGEYDEAATGQRALSALRAHLLPRLREDRAVLAQAEDLWHLGRLSCAENARRAEAYRGWRAGQLSDRVRRLRQVITTALTVHELAGILARELPAFGFSTAALSLYEGTTAPAATSRLVLAYGESGDEDLPSGGVAFDPCLLTPDHLLPAGEAHSLVVQPLYFRAEQLGFMVLGVPEREGASLPGSVHQVVREQISSALKECLLLAENVSLYHTALQAEAEAQEGQRLAEKANLLKSRFLSTVSHELLTPLVLLVGLSEMMLRTAAGRKSPMPESLQQDLTRLNASAHQLNNLVRDVLDLASSQVGQLRLAMKPLALTEVLGPVILVGEEIARGKGLDWCASIPAPADLPQVMGDPTRLQQVILNLVANAVKFTARGKITLTVEVTDDLVTISVRDTGLGVPLEEQEAIFDEFRQSGRTAARGYGGLGIGLAICRQLVEMHGGTIGLSSDGQGGSGSTFYFRLPVLPRHESREPSTSTRSQTVLVLARDPRPALSAYLERHGFAVETSSLDDPSWLSGVLASPPGAIALDLAPDSPEAWDLLQTLKERPQTEPIPVLFYSLDFDSDTGAMVALDEVNKSAGAAALVRALERQGLSPNMPRKTVLVVDDDPAILDLHARIVQGYLPACQVLRAANGRVALETMRRQRPDLVLLDLLMPEVDGLEVLRVMQEQESTRGIPVIVMTAQALNGEEMRTMRGSVAAVLDKGVFTSDETLERIRAALTRSPRLGSDMQRAVRQAMAYVHEHYAESISRDDMARYASVSPRHLTRAFAQELGVTPLAYLHRWRVRQAKRLLDEGGLSITDVAAAVGFSDSSHFAQVFRQEAGVSPRLYRNRSGQAAPTA